jgi:hypothetical protein
VPWPRTLQLLDDHRRTDSSSFGMEPRRLGEALFCMHSWLTHHSLGRSRTALKRPLLLMVSSSQRREVSLRMRMCAFTYLSRLH